MLNTMLEIGFRVILFVLISGWTTSACYFVTYHCKEGD